MSERCLYCYKPLEHGERDFHAHCSRHLFGTAARVELPYCRQQIDELARLTIRAHSAVTGVQPKLSLDFDQMSHSPKRFTIVSQNGRYIIKPQTSEYACLPEMEDVTMHLAQVAGIQTVQHSLLRFNDGELCYITRRIDRLGDGQQLPMEDMCQLSERLTEDKYKGSHELVARLIKQYSTMPQLDLTNYWQQVLFAWIVGNADMHLKNYSLYAPDGHHHVLTPAYDLICTALLLPEDNEELALTLCGKKRKLQRRHFEEAMAQTGLSTTVTGNIIKRMVRCRARWIAVLHNSFLTSEMQQAYIDLIDERLARLQVN